MSKKEVKAARNSVYDTEFANVYSAAVEAVRQLYPMFEENPTTGVIKTAWHQVKFSDPNADDPKSTQVADRAQGTGAASPSPQQLGYNPSMARRLYFIRFNVTVAGLRPFHVRVVGTASELRPGDALPTELRGEAVPHWLGGRTDELQVKIYRRLKRYALPMPDEAPPPVEDEEQVVIAGDLPPAAAAAIADVVRALHKRDYAALRARVADDVQWSLGAAPGADVALAMWQADPTVLGALDKALGGTCHADGAEVVCAAGPDGAPARFGQRAGAWRLVAFVAAAP